MEILKGISSLYQCIDYPTKKTQILDAIYKKQDQQSYAGLLDIAKQNLEELSQHRNFFKRNLSHCCHVGITTSVQELLVILIMNKYRYSNTSQINYTDIRLIMNDLIGLKFDQTTVKYNLDDTPKYNYLHQLINVVVDKNQKNLSTECILEGIKRYNAKISKTSSYGFISQDNLPQNLLPLNNNHESVIENLTLKMNLRDIPQLQDNLLLKNISMVEINNNDEINRGKHPKALYLLHLLVMLGVLKIKTSEIRVNKFIKLHNLLSYQTEYDSFSALPNAFASALEHGLNSKTRVVFRGDILSGNPRSDLLVLSLFSYLEFLGICYELQGSSQTLELMAKAINIPEYLDIRLKIDLISRFYQANPSYKVLTDEVLLEDDSEIVEEITYEDQFIKTKANAQVKISCWSH